MKRMLICLAIGGLGIALVSPVQALPQFRKAFQDKYVDPSPNAELKAAFRKGGCWVCHIKGEEKTVHNRYGKGLEKLIEGNAQERVKAASAGGLAARNAELEKLLKELDEAFKHLEKVKAPEGDTYGDRIKAGHLPVDPETAKPATDEDVKDIVPDKA